MDSVAGPVNVDVPRDRQGSFAPALLPKGQRRIGGLDSMIISLYAGGMTIRDIQHHLASTMGTDLSHETISKITDAVLEEVTAWQERPLEEFYPVIFMDAIRIKVRSDGHVITRSAYIAVGVDMDGIKHVLGIWVQDNEGASFWSGVCAELANRGVADVLIVCCDGLKGFPEAIEATWPNSVVQTCVVHLIRAANRFVSYQDRKAVSKGLKAVYTAVNADAAAKALDEFEAGEWGTKYPQAVAVFRNAWEEFIPFLAFPPMLRKVIYTTNSIESLNYQLKEGHQGPRAFPQHRRCGEAALAGHPQHRGQTSPATRQGSRQTQRQTISTRPARRKDSDHQLEASPRPTRRGLPRTHQPLPLTTPITKKESGGLTQKT